MIARCKGIDEEINFGAQSKPLNINEVPDHEKTSFRPSKWLWKFRNQNNAKNSKLPTNCFEPFGIGGWPPISTWIRKNIKKTIMCSWKMFTFRRKI
jgi:hypothetical protein